MLHVLIKSIIILFHLFLGPSYQYPHELLSISYVLPKFVIQNIKSMYIRFYSMDILHNGCITIASIELNYFQKCKTI